VGSLQKGAGPGVSHRQGLLFLGPTPSGLVTVVWLYVQSPVISRTSLWGGVKTGPAVGDGRACSYNATPGLVEPTPAAAQCVQRRLDRPQQLVQGPRPGIFQAFPGAHIGCPVTAALAAASCWATVPPRAPPGSGAAAAPAGRRRRRLPWSLATAATWGAAAAAWTGSCSGALMAWCPATGSWRGRYPAAAAPRTWPRPAGPR